VAVRGSGAGCQRSEEACGVVSVHCDVAESGAAGGEGPAGLYELQTQAWFEGSHLPGSPIIPTSFRETEHGRGLVHYMATTQSATNVTRKMAEASRADLRDQYRVLCTVNDPDCDLVRNSARLIDTAMEYRRTVFGPADRFQNTQCRTRTYAVRAEICERCERPRNCARLMPVSSHIHGAEPQSLAQTLWFPHRSADRNSFWRLPQ
jgi:hypothetical protein